MSGSFQLELDTKGPDIELTAPNYTTSSAKTDIWIYGNEELSPYQDFYFIDAAGDRRNVLFEHLGDRFHGVMYFNDFPIGISTLYVQVKDKVDNLSNVETVSINISEQYFFSLSVGDYSRNAEASDKSRNIEVSDMNRKVEVSIRNG
ncbi:hypothetical protein [Halobacillus sp. H74]|uniref:hypothetical protein n=1 Tax=Halobacillus sp. H74 TaxID=3457436 RepID=UPI003FCDA0B8